MRTADLQAESEVHLEQRAAAVARDRAADPQTAGVQAAETRAAAEPTAAAKALVVDLDLTVAPRGVRLGTTNAYATVTAVP